MYEAHYGFRQKPFSIIPDPGFLYWGRKHRMALALLEYGLVNQAGFNVVTGEIGTGKTTLIRYLLGQLDRDVTVGLISNTHRSFGELLQWILFAFRLEHRRKEKVEMYEDFVDFLVTQYGQGKRTLLIIDEAQNMAAETLEELRMLSNVNADKDQVLQVILVGQAELRETLRRPDMVQFAQRVAVDYHLEPLDRDETGAYIQHRIAVAGGTNPELFDCAARDAIFEHSQGVPRLVNLLCDTALVYGFAEQKTRIDAQLVHEVAHDKQQGGIFPVGQRNPQPEASAPTQPENPVPAMRRALPEPARPIADRAPAARVGSPASLAGEQPTLDKVRVSQPERMGAGIVVEDPKARRTDLYQKLKAAVGALWQRGD